MNQTHSIEHRYQSPASVIYMKMKRFLQICFIFLTICELRSEDSLSSGEFAKVSLEDASKAISSAALNNDLLLRYATEALESKRPDLTQLCFENQSISFTLDYAVSQLPDSPYKEDLMLMMLKSSSLFWFRLEEYRRFPGHLNIDKTSSPFRAFIKKYLPDFSFDDHSVSTREARAKIADQIKDIRDARPEQRGILPQPNAITPPLKAPANPTFATEHQSSILPWMAGILALLAVVAVALKRRA